MKMKNKLTTLSGIFFLLLFFPVQLLGNNSENTNLLSNGDFEKRGLDGWQKESWNKGGKIESTDKYVHTGKYAVIITSGNIDNDIRLTQEVQVIPNTYYRLSGWIATENVQTGRVGANLSIMSGFDYTGDITGTTGYKYYEMNFRTGESYKRIKIGIRLGMYHNTVRGTAYFDDIQLIKLDYAPRDSIILKKPVTNNPQEKQEEKTIQKEKGTTPNQTKQIVEKDPFSGGVDLVLISILILIGLAPIILNVFFTILKEKKK